MKIPDEIKEQADFLKNQNRELKEMKTINSRSLLTNVLDLNDEVMHVAGEYRFRQSQRSQSGAPPAYVSGSRMARGGVVDEEAADEFEGGGRRSPLLYSAAPMYQRSKSGGSEGAKEEPVVRQSYNRQTGESACDASGEFDDGDKKNKSGAPGSQPRHCCQYRTQMKYILRELQCLSNKVHGDDKKEDIKRYALSES